MQVGLDYRPTRFLSAEKLYRPTDSQVHQVTKVKGVFRLFIAP